jgi:hypothetical protein
MGFKVNPVGQTAIFAVLAVVISATASLGPSAWAQSAATNAPKPPVASFWGRGIPDVSQQQAIALLQMDEDLRPLVQIASVSRVALSTAVFLDPRNDAAIETQVKNLQAAELALANSREIAFAKLQKSSNRLRTDQVAAFAGMGATTTPLSGFGRGSIPDLSQQQSASLEQMTTGLQPLITNVTAASSALAGASLLDRNALGIQAAAEAFGKAELALAKVRAGAFAQLQASAEKLSPAQVAAFTAMGGAFNVFRGLGPLNGPTPLEPLDFNDHKGYVSLFDGVSLKGWDGNSKFWRAECGEIIGESTARNPSGNQYLVYRDVEAHDFTLKLEIKIDNAGGSGIQYRSKTGIPWVPPIPLDVTANVGPVNLNWMMTGPQADFWPSTDPASRFTGQFYSENDPMRIMAARGNVVEGAGLGPKRLMGNIGDPTALYNAVNPAGWNEYTVIARGGTFVQIINGQLMSVMVDDDPNSLNNQSGYFGIELEANAKVEVRNVWLKKLN